MTEGSHAEDGPHGVPPAAVRLWRHLAGDERSLTPGSRTVVQGSRGLARPSWTGVLRLGDAWVIEAGAAEVSHLDILLQLSDPADPEEVRAALPVAETLGPGELAYLPADADVPGADDTAPGLRRRDEVVEVVEVAPDDLVPWLSDLPPADVDEASAADLERPLVAVVDGRWVGVAGSHPWPTGVAHLGVVVAPDARGGGFGRRLGGAATSQALGEGRTPQWRAATDNLASRAVALCLGYREVGRQFSFRLA